MNTAEQKVADLLKPRRMVIADWPEMESIFNYRLNDIILQCGENDFNINGVRCISVREGFDAYPHLFRKLEWWEEREEKDMPEYVKSKHGVFKAAFTIRKSDGLLYVIDATDDKDIWCKMNPDILPATETEYQQYLLTQK